MFRSMMPLKNMGATATEKAVQIIRKIAKQKEEINICILIADLQYSFLSAICGRKDIDCSKINILNVDEYIGLYADDKRTR